MILDILNDMASNASRNYKLEVAQKNAGNDLLKRVVLLAYDPFTQFYIRKIPAYSPTPAGAKPHSLEGALNSLSELSSRNVTGNAGIEHLRVILSSLTAEDAQVIERIIGKDLKVGASESTFNKVWPGLVHEYPCMLCSAFDEKLVKKIKFPAIVQKKEDGMRFNAIVKNGAVEFRSRNGKEIQLLGNLEQEFLTMAAGKNVVFDGELLVANDDGTIGLIDCKVSDSQRESGQFYSPQLEAYAYSLENPAAGKAQTVASMGLLVWKPTTAIGTSVADYGFGVFQKYVPVERDQANFLRVIGEFIEVLEGELPAAGSECQTCTYLVARNALD